LLKYPLKHPCKLKEQIWQTVDYFMEDYEKVIAQAQLSLFFKCLKAQTAEEQLAFMEALLITQNLLLQRAKKNKKVDKFAYCNTHIHFRENGKRPNSFN